VEFLTDYQNAAYADKYRVLVDRVRQAEAAKAKGLVGLGEAVARYYFKLMAYKDEYEVARLYTESGFQDRVKAQFEGDYNALPWRRRCSPSATKTASSPKRSTAPGCLVPSDC
jgi:hypothetical protein